jgi:PAS domain S-box-containing protein
VSAGSPSDPTLRAASSAGELLESLRDEVVWEADRQTLRFLYVSAGAERMFGYPMSDWATDRVTFWRAHLHPDDRERCVRSCLDETEAGRDHELEYRMVRADGSIARVRDRVYLVRDAAGQVTLLRGIITDITEHHRVESALAASEDRLRLALDAAELGIWDYTPATSQLSCSERCYELLGMPRGAPMSYQGYLSRVHPHDRERVAGAGAEAFRAGRELEIQYRIDVPDGGERWVLSRGKSYLDGAGRPIRFIGTMADITERVRSQRALDLVMEQLRTEKLRAEQASRAKDEFLAMLGHELRNPLAPIKTALELIALRQTGMPGREELVIRRQVGRLVRLLDDLLDVSRITGGQVELDRRPVDLAELIDQAIELASPLFDQRRHRLSVSVPRGSLRVFGDEMRLIQVVTNLLDNAARYTPSGGQVSVSARRSDGEVVLEVVDSGVGIQPDLLPRVFDLFVQAERAPDRAEGGLGIGLTLVRTLVRMHGGEVSARSDGAAGSAFEVRLPLLPDGEVELPRDREATEPGRPRRERQSAILVVDDNQDAADLLAEVLRGQGHEVRVAHDGAQALERVSEFRPQVAILDIGLPVMDGYELAVALRARLGPLRLLAVTGYGQERDRARSHEVGFARHFVKPVELTELLDAIDLD